MVPVFAGPSGLQDDQVVPSSQNRRRVTARRRRAANSRASSVASPVASTSSTRPRSRSSGRSVARSTVDSDSSTVEFTPWYEMINGYAAPNPSPSSTISRPDTPASLGPLSSTGPLLSEMGSSSSHVGLSAGGASTSSGEGLFSNSVLGNSDSDDSIEVLAGALGLMMNYETHDDVGHYDINGMDALNFWVCLLDREFRLTFDYLHLRVMYNCNTHQVKCFPAYRPIRHNVED